MPSPALDHTRSAQRQKRQPNGEGQRVLVRAMVHPDVAETAKALARARNCSVAMVLSEALTAKLSGSRI